VDHLEEVLIFSDTNKENVKNARVGKQGTKGTPTKAKAKGPAIQAKSPSPKTQSPMKKTASPRITKATKKSKSQKQVESALNLFGMPQLFPIPLLTCRSRQNSSQKCAKSYDCD
jgi:hypothetical protein